MLKPVIDLINDSKSYEDVTDKLLTTYKAMDTSTAESLLEQASFVVEAMGRINSEN